MVHGRSLYAVRVSSFIEDKNCLRFGTIVATSYLQEKRGGESDELRYTDHVGFISDWNNSMAPHSRSRHAADAYRKPG
jgi:hypothetical protein